MKAWRTHYCDELSVLVFAPNRTRAKTVALQYSYSFDDDLIEWIDLRPVRQPEADSLKSEEGVFEWNDETAPIYRKLGWKHYEESEPCEKCGLYSCDIKKFMPCRECYLCSGCCSCTDRKRSTAASRSSCGR